MSTDPISREETLNISFGYVDSPTDRPFIRLLTLLPGVAKEGSGDPLKCLLTTHSWDPETGFVHHMRENSTDSPLISQRTLSDELYAQPVQHEIESLTKQCCDSKPCAFLTYEALSYEWGKDERRYCISINGQMFNVTPNPQQALYHLRHVGAVLRLWVDAICSNQKSEDDKGKQIQQMDRIYTNANQVVAWLGLAIKNGNLAFEFAGKLYATTSLTPDVKQGTEGELYTNPSRWLNSERYLSSRGYFMHSSYAKEWLALHWLFKRHYWIRAWVFQEVILAKQLCFMCGTKSMTWGVMEIAMHLVRTRASEVVDLVNSSIPIADQNTLFPVTHDNPHHFDLHY